MSILSYEDLCSYNILVKKNILHVNIITAHLILLNLGGIILLYNSQFESVNCNTLLCAGMYVSCSWNMRLMWIMQTVGAEPHFGQLHPWDTQVLLSCCSSGAVMWIASIQKGGRY